MTPDEGAGSAAGNPLALRTDEELILGFARGRLADFDELYRRNEARVWRFIRRSVADRALADEVFQDVWLRVISRARGWQPLAKFSTWLFTLARNRVIDIARAMPPPATVDPLLLDAAGVADPAIEATRSQSGEALLAALARLPAEQREAFLLQAEGDLSVAEIGVAVGVPFETAKSRLRYARVALRAALKEHA